MVFALCLVSCGTDLMSVVVGDRVRKDGGTSGIQAAASLSKQHAAARLPFIAVAGAYLRMVVIVPRFGLHSRRTSTCRLTSELPVRVNELRKPTLLLELSVNIADSCTRR